MRLAVISDSHLSTPDDRFERVYDRHLSGADALLHCGDMVGAALYHSLCRHPRFLSVRGNCDHFILDHDLPNSLAAELVLPSGRKLTIGMAHGWGERATVWQRVAELFPGFDLICFGHTHRRAWTEHQGSHLLNPGSLVEGSLALIDVADDGALTCRFIDVDEES